MEQTIGYGSWLYYAFVLVILYAVLKILYNNYLGIAVIAALSVISNLLTITGIFGHIFIFNIYNNPLNWALFFVIGMLRRRADEKKTNESARKNPIKIILTGAVLIFATLVVIIKDMKVSYWEWWSIAVEITGFIFLYNVSNLLRHINFLKNIGKNTLFIYLAHIQICGAINTRLPVNPAVILSKPILGLLVMYGLIGIIVAAAKLIGAEKYLFLIGIDRGQTSK